MRRFTKTVEVSSDVLRMCAVKAKDARDLSAEEVGYLASWLEHETTSIFADLCLQEILNVYRVSAEYVSFEGWTQEEGDIARAAWNKVVRPANRLMFVGE